MALRLSCSKLTNTIFAGKLNKAETLYLKKEDVTMDALYAVVEHCNNFKEQSGEDVELTDATTGRGYRITITPI